MIYEPVDLPGVDPYAIPPSRRAFSVPSGSEDETTKKVA
jgi:hypothetical protein